MSNPYRLIKQLALLMGFCLVAGTGVLAQQSYYIYIQSDGQPFYTQIGEKVYSSSAAGHLIISGLKDNVCTLEIGFPQHTSRPQQFTVPIRGKDHGYQLKKSGAQDWALVNWQNQETIKPKKGAGTSDLLYGERKKDDAFATLMAAVVNDSAVLYTSIVKNDIPENPVLAATDKNEPEAVAKKEEKPVVADTAMNITATVSTTTITEKPLFDTAKLRVDDVPKADSAVAVYKNEKPLFDTTTAVAKEYKNDKPLYDTTAAVVKEYRNDKPLYDTSTSTAKLPKNDKPSNDNAIIDLTTGKPLYDTSAIREEEEPAVKDSQAAKPVVKESRAVQKQDKPGVVKVQQATKDGETKMVFIDSSESPAAVVTVYISDPVQPKAPAQPVPSDPLTTITPKTETESKPDPEKKPDAAKKIDTVQKEETARKTEPAPAEAKKEEDKPVVSTVVPAETKKEADKPVVNNTAPAETKKEADKPVVSARNESLRVVTDKPVEKKGDTLTVILESRQQRRDTASKAVRQEAPKPLYEPRQTTTPAAAQQNTENQPAALTEEAAKTTAQAAEKDKPAGKTGRKAREDRAKNADKTENNAGFNNQPAGITDKKAFAEPPAAKSEPVAKTESPAIKPEVTAKQEPASTAKKDSAAAKQEAPKALYDPKPTELDKKQVVMINSDCGRFATDTDVDKLRVKMLAEKDVTKRVAVANKVFKTMCLTAKQMKALSELFPTDETKYKFLEMAYPFAADTGNFKQLFELFSDESYQIRFKTLVRY